VRRVQVHLLTYLLNSLLKIYKALVHIVHTGLHIVDLSRHMAVKLDS